MPKGDIQNHEKTCDYHAFLDCPGIRCGAKVSRVRHQHLNSCAGISTGRFSDFGQPIAFEWPNDVKDFCIRLKTEEGHLFFLSLDSKSNDSIMLVREFNSHRIFKNCSIDIKITITGSQSSRAYRGVTVPLNKVANEALDDGNAISVGRAFISNRALVTLCIDRT